jgi:O-antigen/teichoic acid export membrane protein
VSTGRTIIKNVAALVTADILVKAIGFAVVVFMARKLDPADFGVLTFSLSLVNYFSFVTDPGLTTYGVRKAAQEPEAIASHMSDVFTIRLWLTAAAMAAVWALALVTAEPPRVKLAIFAYSLSMLPQALSPTWIYQGLQRMEFLGAYNITQSLCYAGLVFAFIGDGRRLIVVPLALTASYAAAAGVFLFPLLRRYAFRFREVHLRQAMAAVKHSLPIGVSTFLTAGVNWNLSTTLLGFLSSDAQTGIFSVAMKLALIIIGGGVAFGITMLPVFSRLHAASPESSERALALSEKAVFLAGLPLIFGTAATAVPVITLLFGQKYSGSCLAMQLIVPGAVLCVLNNVYNVYLVGVGRQVGNMKIAGVRALLLAGLSFPAIMARGAEGAAAAYTLAEFLSFFIYLGALRTASSPAARLLPALARPAIASTAMFLIIYPIPQSGALLKVPAGALIYAVLIAAVGGVSAAELRKLFSYARSGGERTPGEQ